MPTKRQIKAAQRSINQTRSSGPEKRTITHLRTAARNELRRQAARARVRLT
jgi:hypothetical protein